MYCICIYLSGFNASNPISIIEDDDKSAVTLRVLNEIMNGLKEYRENGIGIGSRASAYEAETKPIFIIKGPVVPMGDMPVYSNTICGQLSPASSRNLLNLVGMFNVKIIMDELKAKNNNNNVCQIVYIFRVRIQKGQY